MKFGKFRQCNIYFFLKGVIPKEPKILKAIGPCPEVEKLQHDLQSLLENGTESDVVFVVDGKEFQLHKAILSARSKVFAAMFESDLQEAKEGRAKIPDVSAEVFEQLLRYIYSGKIPDMDKFALELLVAADKVFGFVNDYVFTLQVLFPLVPIRIPEKTVRTIPIPRTDSGQCRQCIPASRHAQRSRVEVQIHRVHRETLNPSHDHRGMGSDNENQPN